MKLKVSEEKGKIDLSRMKYNKMVELIQTQIGYNINRFHETFFKQFSSKVNLSEALGLLQVSLESNIKNSEFCAKTKQVVSNCKQLFTVNVL